MVQLVVAESNWKPQTHEQQEPSLKLAASSSDLPAWRIPLAICGPSYVCVVDKGEGRVPQKASASMAVQFVSLPLVSQHRGGCGTGTLMHTTSSASKRKPQLQAQPVPSFQFASALAEMPA